MDEPPQQAGEGTIEDDVVEVGDSLAQRSGYDTSLAPRSGYDTSLTPRSGYDTVHVAHCMVWQSV